MTTRRRREPAVTSPANQRGWHDEWTVTGLPSPELGPYENTWRSTDPRWLDGLAEVAAHAFVLAVLEDDTAPPWEEPPRLRHRRVFTGEYEDVQVKARPAWRRPNGPNPLLRRQGAA